MDTQPESAQLIFARIEKLERQNRRLKQIALSGLGLLATLAVMGASGSSRTIEAQRFVLTDSAGRTRAVLGLEEKLYPALTLYTENGKPGVQLSDHGLKILDANGKNTVALDDGLLMLDDPTSSNTLSLAVHGHPYLTMSDHASAVISLGSGEGTEPNLIIWDRDGYASTLGVTTLTDIASGSKRRTSAASLVMENKAGTILWSAETVRQQLDALSAYVGSMRTGYKAPDDVERELDEFKDGVCPLLRRVAASNPFSKLDQACQLHY